MPDERPGGKAKAIFDEAAEIASTESGRLIWIAPAQAIKTSGARSKPCSGPWARPVVSSKGQPTYLSRNGRESDAADFQLRFRWSGESAHPLTCAAVARPGPGPQQALGSRPGAPIDRGAGLAHRPL